MLAADGRVSGGVKYRSEFPVNCVHYNNAARLIPETPESYLGQKFLGKVLKDKGEVQDALRALEAANHLSPDDDEVVRLLEEIRPKADPPKTRDFSDGEAGGETEGPEIVTSSPGFRPKMKEDILPGGVPSGARGGGLAIRTFSMIRPTSSG